MLIDVSEWSSEAAIERAHEMPEVLAMWERFEKCCDFIKLDELAEVHDDFPGFEAI